MAPPPPSIAEFKVDGMTCQNCARHAREAAESVAGVASASVDLSAGRLRLRWAEGGLHDEVAVAEAVGRAGYPTIPLPVAAEAGAHAVLRPGQEWRFNVYFGGSVTAVLMVAEWVLGWGHQAWFGWLALALAAPVQALCGWRFYQGAWNQLKRGASNMDTLVALGSSAAFAYSLWVLLSGVGGHVYFMEGAAIISLISLGHWLEALATDRAAGAVRALMNLRPDKARRIERDGSEREVAVADLRPGDRIRIGPGDRVPTDADVVVGGSAVDEAMLTGESRPVEKAPGDNVLAGTSNLDGRLILEVTTTGEGTVLARIVAAVDRAQNSRAAIQRLADRVSSVFVPLVIGLALLTALGWGLIPETVRAWHDVMARYLWALPLPESPLAAAVLHATAVLIVACPCAMGLATPAAIMAGTNAAALRGILIRDGVALEKAGRIGAVMFDKTGTLTEGRLEVCCVHDVRSVDTSERRDAESLKQLAAGAAKPSGHPVARALAAFAGSQPPSDRRWTDWRELRGRGIEARESGAGAPVFRLGALAWLRECGVAESPTEIGANGTAGAGATFVGLSEGIRMLAVFELRDRLRSDAHDVVATLHAHGFDVFLLSGDAWLAAEAAARDVGIPSAHVLAEVKPEQKAQTVARVQQEGHRVAFVGDGINDGPALAQADLGIAVGRATDVARESADIVLLRPGLMPLIEALGLAQATLRTIHQNLFWAFFYNAAAVPLAMLGFLSPVVCAAAMGLSDLIVIGNALRLRYGTMRGLRRGRRS